MTKKIIGLGLVLLFGMVVAALAQNISIAGKIKNLRAVVFGDKSAILLQLEGRPETYQVVTADAPKFGLLKPATAAGAPDQGKMQQELDAAKGWKVKLTVTPKEGSKGKEFRVKALEKLPSK
jgi:hypothetical protein